GRAVAIRVVSQVVFIHNDLDARVAGGVVARDLHGTIRRAIVDDNQLEISEGLRQYALNCLGDEGFAIVRGHQYAYTGTHLQVSPGDGAHCAYRKIRDPRLIEPAAILQGLLLAAVGARLFEARVEAVVGFHILADIEIADRDVS